MTFERAVSPFKSEFGLFVLYAYQFTRSSHAVLVTENLNPGVPLLVRVQSACLTGTALLAELCDCRQQLHAALRLVSKSEHGGCVLYLDQEGRGHGLREKVEQLALINQGLDTVEAAVSRGRGPDLRDWSEAAVILEDLIGRVPVRLLTNNPSKTAGLIRAGVRVAEEVAIQTRVTNGNRSYLISKRDKMGHRLML